MPVEAVIGGLHQGWAAANTTLAHERAGLGAGGGGAFGMGMPGTVAGHLDLRAGDLAQRSHRLGGPPAGPVVGLAAGPSSSWRGPTAGWPTRSCARTSCGSTS